MKPSAWAENPREALNSKRLAKSHTILTRFVAPSLLLARALKMEVAALKAHHLGQAELTHGDAPPRCWQRGASKICCSNKAHKHADAIEAADAEKRDIKWSSSPASQERTP
jgi:hypothetical protein